MKIRKTKAGPRPSDPKPSPTWREFPVPTTHSLELEAAETELRVANRAEIRAALHVAETESRVARLATSVAEAARRRSDADLETVVCAISHLWAVLLHSRDNDAAREWAGHETNHRLASLFGTRPELEERYRKWGAYFEAQETDREKDDLDGVT